MGTRIAGRLRRPAERRVTSSPDIATGICPGDVLAGKYRVERVLGAGGMGVVVAAHHLQLDERVALKFLLPDGARATRRRSRASSARRAPRSKIKSEHVARVIDVGELENGAPYMVMEYLEGGDLVGMARAARARCRVEQAVDFVLQACEAIAEAHALGIVHRDLKPANLFCVQRADGQLSIKVLDFGISKVIDADGGARPRHDEDERRSSGSPLYMSPEQMQLVEGRRRAHRHLVARASSSSSSLTGRPPFDARGGDRARRSRSPPTPPPPLRSLRARRARRARAGASRGASRRTASGGSRPWASWRSRSRTSGRGGRGRRSSASSGRCGRPAMSTAAASTLGASMQQPPPAVGSPPPRTHRRLMGQTRPRPASRARSRRGGAELPRVSAGLVASRRRDRRRRSCAAGAAT